MRQIHDGHAAAADLALDAIAAAEQLRQRRTVVLAQLRESLGRGTLQQRDVALALRQQTRELGAAIGIATAECVEQG